MKPATDRSARRGALAVEAAVVLPVLLIMMLGLWEVGRIIQLQQILTNSAREGARLAAGGYVNSTPVTNAMVQQAVRDYLQASGLPSAAVSGAEIELVCLVTPGWTNPSDATPLDKFQVKVKLPAGTAFESTRWSPAARITAKTEMQAVVDWVSLNNAEIVVSATLPK